MRAPFLGLILLAACGGDDAMMPGDDVVEDTTPDTRFDAVPGDDLDTADLLGFELGCDDGPCTFECSLDDGAFAACDEVVTLTGLAVGEHTLAARATDGDGDVDATPATHTWSQVFGWRALAGTRAVMCAISGEGGLYCWGHELGGGELGDGGGFQDSLAVATRVGADSDWAWLTAGENVVCGRRADGIYCWGGNWDDQLGDPTLPTQNGAPTRVAHDLASLSIGESHGCGLDDAGALWCWGDGYAGALGTGDEDPQPTPVAIGAATWAQVSAGSYFTCAIDADGALWCWGENDGGQCGQDPLIEEVLVPTRVGARTDWASVHAGPSSACALDDAGALWCWGYLATVTPTPAQVPGAWRDVVTAQSGGCAIDDDGQVSCWGDNQRAQLGSDAEVAQSATPLPIDSTAAFTQVVGRGDLHCALGDRDIVCWGDNQSASGGLGRGVLGGEPQVIAIDAGWAQLAVNHAGGCGVRVNGTLACWGLGFHVGQDLPLAHAPRDVTTDADWTSVAVTPDGTLTRGHACGIRAGELFCWGTNVEGQLGDGTTNLRTRPVAITADSHAWSAVSTSTYSTCALTTDGRVYCWGGGTLSHYGQIGDGTQVQRNAPVAITSPAATGWASVHVFGMRTTALRADGTLWAWGMNPNGAAQTTPAQIGTDTDWVEAVSTVSGVTCARKTSGALYCSDLAFSPSWPRAMLQVGTATDHGTVLPFEGGVCTLRAGVLHCHWGNTGWPDSFPSFDVNGTIPNPSGTWASISVSYAQRCGIRADGGRACAGGRFAGSLGDGFDERVPTPIVVP